jgi:hypothetical protein
MFVLDILSQKLINNLLQLSILATGVISSSYFFYGNIAAAHFGLMPAIQDPHGVGLSVGTSGYY